MREREWERRRRRKMKHEGEHTRAESERQKKSTQENVRNCHLKHGEEENTECRGVESNNRQMTEQKNRNTGPWWRLSETNKTGHRIQNRDNGKCQDEMNKESKSKGKIGTARQERRRELLLEAAFSSSHFSRENRNRRGWFHKKVIAVNLNENKPIRRPLYAEWRTREMGDDTGRGCQQVRPKAAMDKTRPLYNTTVAEQQQNQKHQPTQRK